MTQVHMSIVGQPNISITMFNTQLDQARVYERWVNSHNTKMGDEMPAKLASRNHFHLARQRLAQQGAEDVRLFPFQEGV